MRCCLIIVLVAIMGCQFNNKNLKNPTKNLLSEDCFSYPSIVDSLKVRDLYDSARWYIYTWNCDDKYLPKSDTSASITYGELPLRFNSAGFKHDTINIIFDFIDGNTGMLLSMTGDTKESGTGIGFNINTKTKLYMMYDNMTMTARGGANRYENPLQPDVVAYIKNNWNKLDPCFRALAEQKGIKQ